MGMYQISTNNWLNITNTNSFPIKKKNAPVTFQFNNTYYWENDNLEPNKKKNRK